MLIQFHYRPFSVMKIRRSKKTLLVAHPATTGDKNYEGTFISPLHWSNVYLRKKILEPAHGFRDSFPHRPQIHMDSR